VWLGFVYSLVVHPSPRSNRVLCPWIALVARFALVVSVEPVHGDAAGTQTAIPTRRAWGARARICFLPTRLAVVTGAMSILNVPFTKNAKIITANDVKQANA